MQEQIEKKRKHSRSLQLAADLGKLPPQAVDIEEAVLGALMLGRQALNVVSVVLDGSSFYKDSHQKIFEAIKTLHAANEPVDILTVKQQLQKDGVLELVGGPYYISQLTNRVASSANIEFHSRIILQKFVAREIIRISTNHLHDAYEDTTDVIKLVDQVQSDSFSLNTLFRGKKEQDADQLVSLLERELQKPPLDDDQVIGVSSGFRNLDNITLGFQAGRMYVLAARPGMGKTTYMLQVARNAVSNGDPVAIFSLEMPAVDLMTKMVALETGISSRKIQKRQLNNAELNTVKNALARIRTWKLFIDDSPNLTPFEMMSKSRELRHAHKIKMVMVDYLQLINPVQGNRKFDNRNEEMSFISSAIKALSKDIEMPVIALSQLSREVEKRTSKEPMLSDLRDSGSIEQDADLVMFLYRPSYYGIKADENGVDITDLAKLIIAKNRHDKLDHIFYKFNGATSSFLDFDI